MHSHPIRLLPLAPKPTKLVAHSTSTLPSTIFPLHVNPAVILSPPHSHLILVFHPSVLFFLSFSRTLLSFLPSFCILLLLLKRQYVGGEKRGERMKGMTRRQLVTMATYAACQSVALSVLDLFDNCLPLSAFSPHPLNPFPHSLSLSVSPSSSSCQHSFVSVYLVVLIDNPNWLQEPILHPLVPSVDRLPCVLFS